MKPIPDWVYKTPRPLKRETRSYRDAQCISDADRVKALRRSQFKKGR